MVKNSKRKVLIAEDDRFISEMYITKLSSEGYEVLGVENGEQLMKEAGAFSPDIILLDILMPVMDGLETLKRIKEKEELRNIPVIVLTNANEKEYVTKALDLGAKDYLVKASHTPDEVVVKIKKNLE